MKKNIIISGVSGGIGAGLAAEYVRQGHAVHGCGKRDVFNLPGVCYQSVDLADDLMVERWLKTVIEDAGSIDVCINCTGSLVSGKKLWLYDAQETQKMLDTNVTGMLNLIRHVMPVMIQQGSGRFIAMSSNPAGYPLAGLGMYALCKTGIEKAISVLAEELPSGVVAVALYPGLVNTQMLQQSIGVEAAGDYPEPEQWAGLAAKAILALNKNYHGSHVDLEDVADPR